MFSPSFAMLLLLAQSLPSARAECCNDQLKCKDMWKKCFDCKKRHFWDLYCGKGSCNIFGCNCESGCIKYNPNAECLKECVMKSAFWQDWAKDHHNQVGCGNKPGFREMPSQSDSVVRHLVSLARSDFSPEPLTYREFGTIARQMFTRTNNSRPPRVLNLRREFANLDANKNGVIELTEIDSDFTF